MTGAVTVLGSANMDRIVAVERLPPPGETVAGSAPRTAAGGKGLNQAIAAARQGITTTFVATVGDDIAGEEVLRILAAEHINSDMVRMTDEPTGSAVVLLDGAGENCIVVSSGANGRTSADIAERAIAAAEPDDILLLQLEIPTPTVVSTALQWPGIVILNAAPACALAAELWPAIDILVVNESELDWYSKREDGDIASSMERLPTPTVITTLGGDGCAVRDSSGTYTPIACPDVVALDTTGAGDTFCGVLAATIAAGSATIAAARRATIAAALSTRYVGGQTCPRYSELNSHESSL